MMQEKTRKSLLPEGSVIPKKQSASDHKGENGMSKEITITVSEKRCKQCGICSALCPRQVFTQEIGQIPVVAHLDQCIGCRLCEMRCPDFAIDVEVK